MCRAVGAFLGLGRRVPKARRGRAREGIDPSRWGWGAGLGDSPGKNNDFGGLRGCILKPSEGNFTAFSPAYFFFFYDQFHF